MSTADLDARHVWHPWTQAAVAPAPVPVARAEGAWLVTEDGRRVLDAVSSWWTCIHGHGHPRLVAALARQAATLDHVMLAGLTHAPAARLAARLAALTGLPRVFYSDDGSTAVETALKLAFAFHARRGERRTRFLVLPGAYHGDTVGAMSVSGIPLFRDEYRDLLFRSDPWQGEVGDDVAAVVVEPLLQGSAGMRLRPAAELAEVARQCRAAGALLVADEVLTGFGRTGTMFAVEQAGVAPDLLCVAKGLTAGMLPMAATLASERLFDAFLSHDRGRAFLHGHSYTGNPLGCAVALESLALFDETPVLARARRIGELVLEAVLPLRPRVADVRGLGSMTAVELAADGGYLADVGPRMARAALARGVLLRPLGNVLYALPPYVLTDDEARSLGATMREVVEEVLAAGP
ncbi:MAG: aminotransferase class III-fold pyridoxal phosphate-dependent enzyme [Planctomycetes bacterium]|nr:aminotransferase class III-fold pyridoxal phosphate-dependent enzyme [Planctomycetota bacterium]